MTAAIVADHAGKRYGRRWALQDCSLEIPAGRVVGLVADDGISDAVDGRVVGVVADDGATVAAGGVVVPAVPPHAATANKMADESPTRSR